MRIAALAAVAGVAAGYGAVGFRLAIDGVHFVFSERDRRASSRRPVRSNGSVSSSRQRWAVWISGCRSASSCRAGGPTPSPTSTLRGGKLPLRDGLAQALAGAASIGVGGARGAGGSRFTLQLAARGIDLSRAPGRAAAADISAADPMMSFRAADEATTIPPAHELARAAPRGDLYAVDSQGRLAGVATPAQLHDPAPGGEGSASPTLGDVAETGLPTVRPGDALDRVPGRLDAAKRDLPAVDSGGRPVGVVRREDALAAHNRALLREHAVTRGRT